MAAGCSSGPAVREVPALTPAQAYALTLQLLPRKLGDREGWATDIHAAFAAMELLVSAENLCAAIAVTEQESGFVADPPVAGLAKIAWKEIDERAERYGVPKAVVRGVLGL